MSASTLIPVLSAVLLVQTAPDPASIDALETQAETLREQARARATEAEAAQAELARLQQRLTDAVERIQARETEAENAAIQVKALEAEEADLLARLVTERDGLIRVLAALQRIELADPPALATTPANAVSAARAAGLLARIAPQLDARATAVRARLAELGILRAALDRQTAALVQSREALSLTREDVMVLIEERRAAETTLRAQADGLSQRAARVAEEAASLRDLMADIRLFAAAEPRLAPRPEPRPEPIPRLRPDRPGGIEAGALTEAAPLTVPLGFLRFTDARGQLKPPVSGQLSIGAGERGPDGVQRDGVWFDAQPRAPVTALFDGVVVYSGPFQDFETVLILNTPDEYTIILGGLDLIYVVEGQSLLTGEPVGVMIDRDNPPPQLYLEIRRSTDDAANPEDWLRPEFRKG